MAQGQPKSYRRGQYARNTGATPEQCRASSLYGSMDQAHGWLMRKWNTALGQGIFTFDGTPGANFFRLRGCRSHIVCHKSKNKPFWMSWRSRRLARRIRWNEAQRRKRLSLVANNARFLILPHCHFPNLATRFMGLALERLPQDWQARHGPPARPLGRFLGGAREPGARIR